VVKRARHNQYPVKKNTDKGVRHDEPPTLRIANLPPGHQALHPGRTTATHLNLAA
jgi:hypothetical protein